LAKLGARGMQVHPFPAEHGVPDYPDKRYTRLWSALEDTGIAALNHLALKASLQEIFRRDPTPQKGIYTSLPSLALAETLAFWILTGTLERHPKLKVVLVEPGLGWLPWYLGILDGRMHQHYEFPGVKLLPSEYFKRQVRATFMYEPEGLELCWKKFGPECLLWSTDFPHPATCWPHSQQQVKSQFAEAGVPAADRRKIVCDNAAQAFNV
jgi:predicted TIM-barrel fold metal-dependent hydrolase